MALSCAELRQRLDADERLDAPDVREHVAGCVECRRAFERWHATTGELREWSEELPPPFLHTRIMAGLRAAAEAKPRGWRAWLTQRPLWASSGLAAAFVLIVASVVMLRAPQITRTPAGLDATRGGAPSAAPAAPQYALTASGSDLKREAERQSPPGSSRARRSETSLPKDQPSAPPPPKDLDRGVLLSETSYERKKDALERNATRRGQAEAHRETEEALAAAAPAPQGHGFGGVAPVPPPPTVEGVAVAEAKPIDGRVAKQDKAPERGTAGDVEAPQPKAVVSRVRARLVPLAGGPARSVEVSPVLLASGPRWIDVDAEGQLTVGPQAAQSSAPRAMSLNGRRDAARSYEEPSDKQTLGQQDRKAIQTLGLPPGRYRLERLDE